MGSRKHISRKDISASAFTPKPSPDILQTRGFSNGVKARSNELPTTSDILQTRPFSTPSQKSSDQSKAQPLTPESLEKAEAFGYKAASIPLFAPEPAAQIQAKLTLGEPGDKYEEEADTVAERVVDKINTPQIQQTPVSETVQPDPDNQEKISPKPIVQRQSDPGGIAATPEIESSIEGARGSGEPLADSIREPMEGAFGADFSGVKIHTDSQSDELNQSIQAKAFTTGEDIFFRSGAYQPENRGGQELLAHELTHVVQQTGGLGQKDGVQTQAIQRIAMAAAPAIVFGPVGLAVAVGITGVTLIIWLNNGGWEEIGRITDAIGKGIEGTLQELGDILSRAGNAAVEQFGKIEDYVKKNVFRSDSESKPRVVPRTGDREEELNTMRFQVQWGSNQGGPTFSQVATAPSSTGVTATQAIAALETTVASVTPKKALQAAQPAKVKQIAWISSRPPAGIAIGGYSKSAYFNYGNYKDARVDVENIRGHNIRI